MSGTINKLILGDCLLKMGEIDDNSIDLTVTSPPYDDLRSYNGFEYSSWDVANELFRITKEGGVVVWVTNDSVIKGSESMTSFETALFFRESGFRLHDTMIWHKPHFSNPSTNRCHQVFEYMFVFSKGKPKTFNQIRDVPIKYGKPFGKTSLRNRDGTITNTKTERGSVVGQFGGRSNVWKMNTVGQDNFGKKVLHPAMFPEKLARDHIRSWSNPGDVVFDPFMGAGTTLVEARKLNRQYIGIEISAEYVEITRERLASIETSKIMEVTK